MNHTLNQSTHTSIQSRKIIFFKVPISKTTIGALIDAAHGLYWGRVYFQSFKQFNEERVKCYYICNDTKSRNLTAPICTKLTTPRTSWGRNRGKGTSHDQWLGVEEW